MNKIIKMYLITVGMFIVTLTSVIVYYNTKIDKIASEHEEYLSVVKEDYEIEIKDLNVYKYLYEENKKDLDTAERKYKSIKQEYTDFKNTVAYAKNTVMYTRGPSSDLTKFDPITAEDLNEWIKEKAPKNSPFIGKGQVFITAANESGLDPKYLIAHAALESSWGTSNIANLKSNYFGIGSFNASPTSSSYSFSSFEDGIIRGSKWIANNYASKGQNTLEKMIYGGPAYCQTSSGAPDGNWIYKINRIMN